MVKLGTDSFILRSKKVSSQSKVIIVDDNQDDLFLIQNLLQCEAPTTQVIPCKSVADARAVLQAEHAIDLVILDLKMPDEDGYDAIKTIRTDMETVHIPIIVLSGSEDPGDIGRAYYAGASAYLIKPDQMDEYSEMIRYLAGFWLRYCRFF